MRTVVIKMDNPVKDAAGAQTYPVQLFFDDGRPDWLKQQPLAEGSIPENLSVANPPLDPVRKIPVDGEQIRDDFLNEVHSSDRFEVWGDYLHQLLFQSDIATELNRLRGLYPREVAEQSEGLRTILDIRPDVLRWLPWELLFKAPLPLFFDPANPFARGTLEGQVSGKEFTWPIHALIVVGSEKKDPAVNAEIEVDAIQYAFIKSPIPIDWYVCYRPTKDELTKLITSFKPQIFHFIGHGKPLNNSSYLELTDRNGVQPAEEWTISDIAIDFLNWKPRFAFINACRTSSAAGQKNSWDIARAFIDAKVPAVAGMQADIQGEAAAAFSGKLYQSLVNDLPIDRALAEARTAVRNLKTITIKRRDWAVATLYLQQVPEHIMQVKPPFDRKTFEKFRVDSKLKETRDFVGRVKQRRKLWYGVDQIDDWQNEFSSLCIVVGHEKIGKTALVQASMKVCALRDRRISYVDIGPPTTKDFVQVLKIIREGDPKSSEIICAPLPDAPFADFDKKYGALLQKPDATTILAGDDHLREQLFTAYKDALVEIAATQPLIIVLDHLNVEWGTFNSILVEKLLLPIAQNSLQNCRLVLVCTPSEFNNQLPKEFKDLATVVDVTSWKPEKYLPLARQICIYNDIELQPKIENIIKTYSDAVTNEWEPSQLRLMLQLIKALGN